MAAESRWGVDAWGLKIEDRECVANAEYICKVPGLAFAEWGPGDMGMSYGFADAHDPPYPPVMEEARSIVKGACDENGIHFLCSWEGFFKECGREYSVFDGLGRQDSVWRRRRSGENRSRNFW